MMLRIVLTIMAWLVIACGVCQAESAGNKAPSSQILAAGERMYREGLLPSGEPMKALVQGDIPVDGTMFTCQTCHLRSGLGVTEGTIITLPVNGAKLFRPLHRGAETETSPARHQLAQPFQSEDIRPPYTDETLAQAIWVGTTPNGRELDPTMPRYLLDPADMDILIQYLKQLSATFSPGVDENTLYLATVVTDDVPEHQKQSMLGVLKAYIRDYNSQSRHNEKRARKGPFYRQDRFRAYRRLDLSIWNLHGPPDTWEKQLEEQYARKPVFALVGGITTRTWKPIETFCNRRQIPNIFPITPYEGQQPGNWYTLYFSREFVEEGETAASYLADQTDTAAPAPIQIVGNRRESRLLAQSAARQWLKLGKKPMPTLTLPADKEKRRRFWSDIFARKDTSWLLVWLGTSELDEFFAFVSQVPKPPRLMLSWKLLEKKGEEIPRPWRASAVLTYPYRLPNQLKNRLGFVKSWLRLKKLPEIDLEIQARMYFLGWILTGALRMMGDDFYRDYFLDVIDMMNDEVYAIATVPRVSFGPGQRYAVKGCYIVAMDSDNPRRLTALTPWVLH